MNILTKIANSHLTFDNHQQGCNQGVGPGIFPQLVQVAGGLPYKSSNGDARHLSLWCKLQILASLGVFGMESYY